MTLFISQFIFLYLFTFCLKNVSSSTFLIHFRISQSPSLILKVLAFRIEFKQQNNLAMSEHEQTSDNESFLNMAECQQLKKKIALSSSQLIQLTYSEQKFNLKLEQFNKQACTYIEDEKYPQAAVYLDQAERVLQYSAGCGKTIERSLITTILNNQACLLQRTSDFQQSANYLEAIIFNINDFLEGAPPVSYVPNIINCHSQQYADFSTFIERKISLALYHLRFCALTSHSKNNELALKSARKALNLLREITIEEHNYESYAEKQQSNVSQKSSEEGMIHSLFKDMSKMKSVESYSFQQFDGLLNKTLFYILEYKKNCNSHGFTELEEMFESYSIGNLMQATVMPINLKPNSKEFMEKEFSLIGKTFRAIHTSMAFFTVATELRLISAAKYALDDDVRKSSEQYKESKISHLVSIMLIARFLPFKTVFYDHAIFSFKNHYSLNLQEMSQNYSHKHTPVRKQQVRQSKTRSQVSVENNKTMEIHDTKENQDLLDQNIIKHSQMTHRNFQIAEIQNRNLQVKKLKQVKSKSKFLKIGTESSKTIESDKNTVLHQSKNKENKIKNTKLLSKGKETIRSRAKNLKNEDDEEQRKGIYYGFTSKSRSKSKKEIGFEKRSSKKGLQTIKSGLVFQHKKIKNEAKIDEQYGVKSMGGFQHKLLSSKVKKSKGLRTSQTNQEECQYLIKFNKISNGEYQGMKKLKSPRNLKKETSRRKTLSKDKFNL